MDFTLKNSRLFMQMSDAQIEECLTCSGARIINYKKNETVFHQSDTPRYLFVLLEGAVAVCRDSISGKRIMITTISQSGDLFGEVYLFLDKNEYDYYAMAVDRASVLQIPKTFLYENCSKRCGHHVLLIRNMLSILAYKAYYLNQKLQLMSSGSLRQKIAKVLFDHASSDGTVKLQMKREELADFLSVARPSLSRELMKMREDGLLALEGKKIRITDMDGLENCL